MGFYILHAHDLEAVAAVLGFEHSVIGDGLSTVALSGNVPQRRVKTQLILKIVIFIHGVCLDDGHFAGTVGQIDEAFIAKLELALHPPVIPEGNQVGLSKGRIRLQPKLSGGHHGSKE